MKFLPIVFFAGLGIVASESRHDRRGSKAIYNPKELMDQLNVQKDLPDPILELAELANNNNNNSEDPRLSRQLSVTGAQARAQRQFARQQQFQNPIDNQGPDQFRDPLQDTIQAQIPNPINGLNEFPSDFDVSDEGSYSYSNPGGFTNFKIGNGALESPKSFNGQIQGLAPNSFPRPNLRAFPAVPLEGQDQLGRDFPAGHLGFNQGGPNPQIGANGFGGFASFPLNQGLQYPGVDNLSAANNFGSNGFIGGRPGFAGQAGLVGQQYPGFGTLNNGLGAGFGTLNNGLSAGIGNLNNGFGSGYGGNQAFGGRPGFQQGSFGSFPNNQGFQYPGLNAGLGSGLNTAGFGPGLNNGFGSGLNQGFGSGLNNGFGTGLNQGFGSGLNNGFGSGLNNGFGSGLNNGFGSGLNQGFGSGLNNGFGGDFGVNPNRPGFQQGSFGAFPQNQGLGQNQGLSLNQGLQGGLNYPGYRPNNLQGAGLAGNSVGAFP